MEIHFVLQKRAIECRSLELLEAGHCRRMIFRRLVVRRRSGRHREFLREIATELSNLLVCQDQHRTKVAYFLGGAKPRRKSAGFDVKTLRQVVRLRKLDKSDRQEQEALLDLYKRALDLD